MIKLKRTAFGYSHGNYKVFPIYYWPTNATQERLGGWTLEYPDGSTTPFYRLRTVRNAIAANKERE